MASMPKARETPESSAAKTAREMVGDGQLPNKYWVSISADYITNKESAASNEYDNASDHYEDLPSRGDIFGPYDTFAEAREKAEELYNSGEIVSPDDDWDAFHSVMIEDRLSGTIYDGVYREDWTKHPRFPSVRHEWEWNDETRYTREEMANRGARFE